MKRSPSYKRNVVKLFCFLKRQKRRISIGASLGILLALFLMNTHFLINQSPSLSYKAFICIKVMSPGKGDIVSIENHPTPYFKDVHTTKRLVGFSGDRIRVKNGHLYVEKSLIGPFLNRTSDGHILHPIQMRVIPKGYVFVAGDHPRSFDSRYVEFGLVKKENVKGQCFGILKSAEGAS